MPLMSTEVGTLKGSTKTSHATVYVVDWTSKEVKRSFLPFHSKFKRVVQIFEENRLTIVQGSKANPVLLFFQDVSP